jgi:hypothetical protein
MIYPYLVDWNGVNATIKSYMPRNFINIPRRTPSLLVVNRQISREAIIDLRKIPLTIKDINILNFSPHRFDHLVRYETILQLREVVFILEEMKKCIV